jgi:3-methyladenine DNA glycosylase/8-oxoguanine DNA glycosylase
VTAGASPRAARAPSTARTAACRVRLSVPADFSLESTLLYHGYVQTAPFSWTHDGLGRIDRLRPGGRPYRVRVHQEKRELVLSVDGARSVPADYVERVRRMLQLDVSLAAFHRVVRREPHLAWMARRRMGRILRTGDFFEDVVKALCGTNVQWAQAVGMANRICTLGPRLGSEHAFPTPSEVLAAGSAWLREHARVGYRADYVIALAEDIDSGRVDAEAFERDAASLGGDAIRRRLLGLRGIGPSTARYLAGFFGCFDAVSVDSAVIACFTRVHGHGRRPTPAEVEKHFDRYGDHRGRVCWFEVWKDYRDQRGLAWP